MLKYFNYCIEYPRITDMILPINGLYSYISSTFLEGFINYVDIKKAFIITRYNSYSKNLESVQKIEQKNKYHTKLSEFDDDILILAKSKEGKQGLSSKIWWFFWFDCDVSDCQIGRFESYDEEQVIIDEFVKYVNETSLYISKEYSGNKGCIENIGGKPAIELNIKKFNGWIGW